MKERWTFIEIIKEEDNVHSVDKIIQQIENKIIRKSFCMSYPRIPSVNFYLFFIIYNVKLNCVYRNVLKTIYSLMKRVEYLSYICFCFRLDLHF